MSFLDVDNNRMDMKALRWVVAASSAVLACGAQETSNSGDAGGFGDSQAAGDANDSGTSRSCPMRSQVFSTVACSVDPTMMCPGPDGAPACPACEFLATSCLCTAGAWVCHDNETQVCNQRRCPMDSGVDTGAGDARAEAGDAAEQ